jgi:hypothetical protein
MSSYLLPAPPIPGFVGWVYGADGSPVGTCFQVAPGVLVTAFHVLVDAQSGEPGQPVHVLAAVDAIAREDDPERGPRRLGDETYARVLAVDAEYDLAVLRCTRPFPDVVAGFTPAFSEEPRTEVDAFGFAVVPDTASYGYLPVTGTWQGTTRRDGIDIGHVSAPNAMPGMSGAAVVRSADKAVLGLLTGRYVNPDGHRMRDSTWVVCSESLCRALERLPGIVVEPRFVLAGGRARVLLVASVTDGPPDRRIPERAEEVGPYETASPAVDILRSLADPVPDAGLLMKLLSELTDEAAASGEHSAAAKREFWALLRAGGLEPRLLLPGLDGRGSAARAWTGDGPVFADLPGPRALPAAGSMLARFRAALRDRIDTGLFVQIPPTCRRLFKAALGNDRSPETLQFLATARRLLADAEDSGYAATGAPEGDQPQPEGSREAGHRRDVRNAARRLCQVPDAAIYFTGRDDLVSEITGKVRGAKNSGAVALLHGEPGVGTSEVAKAVARALAPEFDDGAYYLNLYNEDDSAPAWTDSRHAVRILADAMNIDLRATDEEKVIGQFTDQLAGRKVLLLLDDARDAKHVARIAKRIRSCAIIVTCRDRRQTYVNPGLEFRVAPLVRPESTALLTAFSGAKSPDPAVLAAIAELCADVPLALVIIGTQLSRPDIDPGELLADLEAEATRLHYLNGGDRSIAAAIGVSYGLLGATAQRSFRLIPAFPGLTVTKWSLSHCMQDEPAEQRQILLRLTDRNLAASLPFARFSLHKLVRLYAASRMKEEETPESLQEFRVLAIWYIYQRLVEIIQRSPDADIPAELEPGVFHEAEQLAEELDRLDMAAHLATGIWHLYTARREADQMIRATACRRAVHLKRGDPRSAAGAVLQNAAQLRRLQEWQSAEEAARDALQLGQDHDLPPVQARALFELSRDSGEQEHWTEAISYGDQSIERFVALGSGGGADPSLLNEAMSAMLNNADFAASNGDHPSSRRYAERAAEYARQVNDNDRLRHAAFAIASAAAKLKDFAAARDNNLLSERISEAQGSWWNAFVGAHNGAYALLELKRQADCEQALVRAAGHLERDPDLSGNLAEHLVNLSAFQVRREALNRAAETLILAMGKADNRYPLLRYEVEVRTAIAYRLGQRGSTVQPTRPSGSHEPDPALTAAHQRLSALRPGQQPDPRTRNSWVALLRDNARHHVDPPAGNRYYELTEGSDG